MVNNRGFTLLEVLIAVAMISVIGAIAIISFATWLPNYKLKGAARDLYSTLQKARMIAVKTNGNSAVIFDLANNNYSLCDNWNSSTSSCDGSLTTTDLTLLGYGIGFGHGDATSAIGVGFDNEVTYAGDDVVFNSRGLCDASGYVYLENTSGSTYSVGSLTSGAVRILKWHGGTWE